MKAIFHNDELYPLDNGNFKFEYQLILKDSKDDSKDETIYRTQDLSQKQVQEMFDSTGWTDVAYDFFKRQLDPHPEETKWDFYMANEFDLLDSKDLEYICKKLWLLHFKNEDVTPLKEKYEALLNLAA